MDRYVSRASWRTMDYSTVASSGYGRVNVDRSKKPSSNAKLDKNTLKMPLAALQEKPLDNLKSAIEGGAFSTAAQGRRLSIRDERLLKIFTSQPDQPLFDPLASDSGCSSSSDSFPCNGNKQQQRQQFDVDENTPPVTTEEINLHSNDTSTDGNRLANLQVSEVLLIQDIEDYPSTPPQLALLATDLPLPSTPKNNPLIMRIQRDLNSSSASARLRALKAIKCPTKSAYTQFDVPHDEQSIITAEERQATPIPPPSIQELMQNIIVYVEVRTGEDNRSVGVKKVISALGAKVNDKLLRDTTHVVFKDGLLSTYKKAKAWNIPVVSILWIEACKNQRKICDPFEFPISNIDRYENPELYEKMKRHKSMQPDSEANKRIRVKPSTPKDSTNTTTPKTSASKKTSTLPGGTPWSTNNKKTDISRFFKHFGSQTKSSTATNVDVPDTSTDYVDFPTESPATQFLNKINADFYTISRPKPNANTSELIVTEDEESQDYLLYLPDVNHVRKTLNFVPEDIVDTPSPKTSVRGTQTRRTTTMIQMAATIEATTNSIEEMSLSQTPNKTKNVTNYNEKMMTLQTPKRKSSVKITTPSRSSARRRNSMHSCIMVNGNVSQDFAGSNKKATRINNDISTITEEDPTTNVSKPASPTTPKSKKTVRNRRTICTAKSLQITQMTKDTKKSISNYKAEEDLKQADKKVKELKQQHKKLSNEPKPAGVEMEEDRVDDLIKIKSNSNLIANKRRTLFTPQELEKSYSNNHLETKTTTSLTKCVPSVTKSFPSAAKGVPSTVKCLPNDNNCSTIYGGEMQTTSNMADFKQLTTPTPVASSTLKSQNNDDFGEITATPPQLIGSLLEEHANARVFSSTRNPGRRRTLFDVSMDIITQRLQNINQSSAARRSMARPSNYDLEVRRNSLEQETPQLLSPVFSSMPNLPIANTCKLKLFSRPTETAKVAENEVITNTKPTVSEDQNAKSVAAVPTNDVTAQTPVIKKKRKLFVLNESSSIAEPPMACVSRNSVSTTPRSSTKRRRTLMPLAQPQSDIKSISSTITPSKSATLIASNGKQVENSTNVATVKNTRAPRRSTLDFESATKLKVCATTGTKKIVGAGNKAPTSSQNVMDAKNNNNNSQKTAANKSKYWPNTPAAYLVYTNMHKEQIEVIKQAVAKLGLFTLEDNVSDATTHVVSMEPRRTLNLLRALSRGLWILEFSWIEDSLRAGIWLSEEQYEMKDFSRAVEICRAERQAFGKDYRSELFTGLGLFYLPTRCGPLQKEDLTELIELCGGKVTDQRRRAKYILGDANRIMDDKSYITPFWILDSITQMQLQKLSKYVPLITDNACAAVASASVPSSSQQQQSSQSNPPRAQCVIHDAK